MSQIYNLIDEIPDAERFLESAGTCYGKNYQTAISGFFTQFKDTFFYANIIQFLIVALMYVNIGKGKYWDILFYASASGFVGASIENATVAYICQESERKKNYKVISFLIAEFFWITCEYSIPFLNLIKMKAFSKGSMAKTINYAILGLFLPFTLCRFAIGFERMNKGILSSQKISNLHGYAFGFMAIADILCTISILYFIQKHSKKSFNASNISSYIKHSSYTILIAVDIVSFLLSTLSIITNFGMFADYIPSSIATPFHCLKSSFVLILASDALLFKYGATAGSSINASSSCNSVKLQNYNNEFNNNSNNNNNGKGSNLYKVNNNHIIDVNSKSTTSGLKTLTNSSSNTTNNMSTTQNSSIYHSASYNTSNIIAPQKSILKNYTTNIKTSPNLYSQVIYDGEPHFGGYFHQQ
ncbi:hypothetical protein BCR36DRAFT_585264 [Piromyces finnis]|uniref:Uncharacterized protein n=1 Tax=Piromyces finnis TaxID=1754191 RepID=A0A1Y1V3U0_9FUNG|nr:hypothetical protein BCR36DRAFT_585264 [Piromyces finnis]|eukprot:ORX46449.1 hypothetical protein BCR36DRAFT_585264 [Piromyces finnis]